MNILLQFLLFFSTFLIGYCFASALNIKNILEKIGLSFLLGTLWLTLVSFLIHIFFSYPFIPSLIVCTLGLGLGISITLSKFPCLTELYKYVLKTVMKKYSFFEKVILTLIILFFVSSIFQNYIWPVTDWDALALYDFRARVLVQNTNFTEGKTLGYFYQYPPYTSLLHATSYVFHLEEAKLWYSAIYISFITTFYALLRKSVDRTVALTGALLLAISPQIFEHATIAYTNLSYTIFFVIGILYLWLWWKEGGWQQGFLGAFFIGASLWVRQTEPFWILGVLLVIVGGLKYKRQWPMSLIGLIWIFEMRKFWASMVEIITQPTQLLPLPATEQPIESIQIPFSHQIIQTALIFLGVHISVDELLRNSVSMIGQQFSQVMIYLYGYVFPSISYLLIPFFVVLYYEWKHGLTSWRAVILLSILFLIAALILGTLLFSLSFVSWDQIGGSAQRMSMFLSPLLLFFIMSSSIWNTIHTQKNDHRH